MKYQNLLITQEEINANSVSSSADILSGTVEENKQVFDNLADVISDKFNNLSNTVQEDFDARYTKEEADAKINEKMIDIGAGDMAASVYDTNHDGVVDTSSNGNSKYLHDFSNLNGTGNFGFFKATSNGEYSSFIINQINYLVKSGNETSIELVSGLWYSFILDEEDHTINFKFGGEVSYIKLEFALTRPSSPKENTIWVESDMWELQDVFYTIGYTYPLSPQLNELFFKVSNVKSAYIHPYKNHQIQISLCSAEYWDGSSWQSLYFETFIDNKWNKALFHYFKDGVTDYYWDSFTNTGDTGGGISNDHLLFRTRIASWNGDSGNGNIHSRETIDLTHINTITIEVSEINNGSNSNFTPFFNLSSITNFHVQNPRSAALKALTVGTNTLNVSHVKGEYYIGVYGWNTTTSNYGYVTISSIIGN